MLVAVAVVVVFVIATIADGLVFKNYTCSLRGAHFTDMSQKARYKWVEDGWKNPPYEITKSDWKHVRGRPYEASFLRQDQRLPR